MHEKKLRCHGADGISAGCVSLTGCGHGPDTAISAIPVMLRPTVVPSPRFVSWRFVPDGPRILPEPSWSPPTRPPKSLAV
jgi:hypothetical protein